MKRISCLVFIATLAVGSILIGCGPGGDSSSGGSSAAKQPRIAFVSNGVASFWVIAQRGVEQAGKDLGVKVSVDMPAEGISDQKRILEDLITRGVDGISVSPIDPTNQTEILNTAAERTKLITNDSDAPDSNRLLYIGMDNYSAGRMCGELVKEALPAGGKVMIFVGRMEQDNARRRRQGVIDEILDRSHDPGRFDPPNAVLKGEKFEILGTLTDQFDRAKAKANAEDTLAKYPDVAGMIGLFAYNPPACMEALLQAGKLNQVKVIAFDEDDRVLQGIIDGTVYGTVVQNPYGYGYKSIEVLKKIIEGDDSVIPENKFIDIPARHIRKDNVEAFWSDLKSKVGDGG